MADVGRVPTPVGDGQPRHVVRHRVGSQAYYLLGATRRALVVAGPISTAMARLEARRFNAVRRSSDDSLADGASSSVGAATGLGRTVAPPFRKVDVDAVDGVRSEAHG